MTRSASIRCAITSILPVVVGGLSIALPRIAAAQDLAVNDVMTLLRRQNIKSLTVVTHGYQLSNGGGNSMLSLAQSIADTMNARTETAWLVDWNMPNDRAAATINGAVSQLPEANARGLDGHVILLWDWAADSNNDAPGWAEGAGDSLFAVAAAMGAVKPRHNTGATMHFIAHSFGSAVITEAVERMARYHVPVDQMTFLDAHDFDQPFLPNDTNPQLYNLNQPPGYGAAVWNNVAFADSYYQERGSPSGRPIPGAYNVFFNNDELPEPPLESLDHTWMWESFYRVTIHGLGGEYNGPDGTLDQMPGSGWTAYTGNSGYSYSAFAHDADRPDPVFYHSTMNPQSHRYSSETLVNRADGSPNTDDFTGLPTLGLHDGQITNARWEPQWDRLSVFNGDFSGPDGGDGTVFIDHRNLVPGWSSHGGSGTGDVVIDNGNRVMQLKVDDHVRIHNLLYVPHDAVALKFDWRIATEGGNDFVVRIGDKTVFSANLNVDGDPAFTQQYRTQTAFVPLTLRGTSTTLSFLIDQAGLGGISSAVRFDNVMWSTTIPEPATVAVLALAMMGWRRSRRHGFFRRTTCSTTITMPATNSSATPA